MKLAFRWFGEGYDPIPLSYIRQIPCVDSVVSSLLDIPAGEMFPMAKIRKMQDAVNEAGLGLDVIESVNVHEDIKLGLPGRDEKIEAYIATMKNLENIGIKVICYNFMPMLDWVRSELNYTLPDDSKTMLFNKEFIMNTTPEKLAARYAEQSGGHALPGWEPERIAYLSDTISRYRNIPQEDYLENARYFINAVIPWAEKLDIRMAAHPDDPPWPVFGLPRLINNRDSIKRFLDLNQSLYHGITMCTGSLGSDPSNDITAIIKEFSERIPFAHIRNLKFLANNDFYESPHPTACGSLDMYAVIKALFDCGFNGYIRPDHGRMVWGETGRPGYGLYDRAMGITYIAGLWEAIERESKT